MAFFSDLYTRSVTAKTLFRARKAVTLAGQFAEEADLASFPSQRLVQEFMALSVPGKGTGLATLAKGLAYVREAARRSLTLPHYDVQLMGGMVLLEGKLAEMRTGEGKTLTVTLPAALLALAKKGVHVVTANEYLAQRDAALMRPVYEALGLTVGVIAAGQTPDEKRAAYACDVTYGVGSEFGFDFLKDNLAQQHGDRVQRGLYAAIVDEVDSILIDEARVPLIIAEPAKDLSEPARVLDSIVRGLRAGEHYEVNLKERTADLTEAGYAEVEKQLCSTGHFATGQDIYSAANLHWVRLLHAAVKAYALYRKDRDYVVTDGAILLVDVGTGRAMEGRRLNDGLHEALEAREGLHVQAGTATRASITYQSFFCSYERLSGLTGTAATDADEFAEIYNLLTVVVPTNKPPARRQLEDLVYLTKRQKFEAATEIVKQRHLAGQPVLVGCASIRDAELMDRLLTEAGVPHATLTAKHVAREAAIIAEAGEPGAVTVATNMAGRGTDIHLGGVRPEEADCESPAEFEQALRDWEGNRARALKSGGLFVLGTERNGLRRVDNQLAGRSGRQGDPGEVQFLLSLEDELLGVFGRSGQLSAVRKLLEESGQALGGSSIGRLVTAAQQSVELQGFSARKSLLKFDTVLAEQRTAVYALRDQLLHEGALPYVCGAALAAVELWLSENMPKDSFPETWDSGALKRTLATDYGLDVPLLRWVNVEELSAEEIFQKTMALAVDKLDALALTEATARALALRTLDEAWAEHLTVLKELQDSAGLKSMAGQNAAHQFPKEAFALFQSFSKSLGDELARQLLPDNRLTLQQQALEQQRDALEQGRAASAKVQDALTQRWVSRNEPCPCESGLRFKDCHGKLHG